MGKPMLTGGGSNCATRCCQSDPMMRHISKAAMLSMDALFAGLRWSFLLAPALLSFANLARAETLRYDMAIDYVLTDLDETGQSAAPARLAVAQFGPFRVVSAERVELNGVITSETPAQFRTMLAQHPGLRAIEMIDCPGSEDDDANLELARLVHRAGLSTYVPEHGSVRSGGVELFLAGVERHAAPGAQFGVHSWQDSDGFEADDYPPSDPVHQNYIGYYVDMGMTPQAARAFYDFTNRVADFDTVHYMTPAELTRFGLTSAH